MEKNPHPSPPRDEPDLKKPKMSSTDGENSDANPSKPQRFKRRKIAIFFAYCGVGYQGMQKNPGAKTIEGDLEEALYNSGGVPDHDRGKPRNYDWARSARTDKGVSAVGQVVSGRFYIDPPGFIDRLNSNLSPQIRIFGFKRVTASFNAKKFCDRRRYVYMLPVFALDPCSHRDRESVMASVGSDNELVKCLECSERGRKVVGAVGKHSFEPEGVKVSKCKGPDSDIVESDVKEENNVGDNQNSEPKKEVSVVESPSGDSGSVLRNGSNADIAELDVQDESIVGDNQNSDPIKDVNVVESVSATSNASEETMTGDAINGNVGDVKGIEEDPFRYGEKEKERFNRILNYYVGSHNFHNFTTRTKAEDPAARRYIISFNARSTVNVDGIEFVKCEVVGQSFMLHQIRKMMGLAVAIMRNCAPESLISTALSKDVNINVPTAPEVGLYLDECLFTSYNQKWRDSHEEVSMKAYEEEAEEFKLKHIYSHIASTEHKQGVAALWLHSLNHRNYPDLRFNLDHTVKGEEIAELKDLAE